MSGEPVVSASIYHKYKDGVLQPLDHKTSQAILAAAANGLRYVRMGVTSPTFDLKTMKQLRQGPFDEEEIVIEIPWNAKSLKAASSLDKGDSGRRKILEMAIDRIVAEQSLSKILDLKDMPARSVRENPSLGRGHLPYDNFVDSVLAATLSTEPSGDMLYDTMVEIASDGPTGESLDLLEDGGLRLVFHGTNEAVLNDILETGLLPQFRAPKTLDQDWFGIKYTVSMAYARKKTPGGKATKLLFFMVLHACGLYSSDYNMVSSGSNRFQLPVAEITLK